MADNISIYDSSLQANNVGFDDISSVKYQRIKLIHGADGINDGDVSSANPLPVTANLSATDNTVLDSIQTAVEAIQAGQLADSHNVTVDNASIAVTATGTVDLGATDNAVLDDIASKLGTIDTDTSTLSAVDYATQTTLAAIDTDTSNISTKIDTLAGAVAGTEMQVDIVTLPNTITGIGCGIKTVSIAGTDEAIAGSTTCKRVIIQAQTDNTGFIAVGASGVDATVAIGNGVLLGAGDVFELEIDNLADIFIDATVNGDGVRFTYLT